MVERAETVEAEEEKTPWDLVNAHKIPEARATKAAETHSLFSGDQRHSAQYTTQKVFSEYQETLFTVRMTEHRFPGEVVWHIQPCLDTILCTQLWLSLSEQSTAVSGGPFQLQSYRFFLIPLCCLVGGEGEGEENLV